MGIRRKIIEPTYAISRREEGVWDGAYAGSNRPGISGQVQSGNNGTYPVLDRSDLVLDSQADKFQLLHFALPSCRLAIVDQTVEPTMPAFQVLKIMSHDKLLAEADLCRGQLFI